MKQFTVAVGKKKTSIAKVFLTEGDELEVYVNNKNFKNYLKCFSDKIIKPFLLVKNSNFIIRCFVRGGGISSQSSAILHGISKAISVCSHRYNNVLNNNSLLTRDSRIVERKKYGRSKARKKFQFSKR